MNKHNGINLSKITLIEYIESIHVDSMVINPVEGTALPELQPGKTFQQLYHTPDTARFSAEPSSGEEGARGYYTLEVQAEVPKLTQGRFSLLDELSGKQLIVRLTTAEGALIILGTHKSPGRMIVGGSIGARVADPHQMQISIIARSVYGVLLQRT